PVNPLLPPFMEHLCRREAVQPCREPVRIGAGRADPDSVAAVLTPESGLTVDPPDHSCCAAVAAAVDDANSTGELGPALPILPQPEVGAREVMQLVDHLLERGCA